MQCMFYRLLQLYESDGHTFLVSGSSDKCVYLIHITVYTCTIHVTHVCTCTCRKSTDIYIYHHIHHVANKLPVSCNELQGDLTSMYMCAHTLYMNRKESVQNMFLVCGSCVFASLNTSSTLVLVLALYYSSISR